MRVIHEIPVRLVPAVTSAEMAAVDRAVVGDYGIDLIQMMENAGRALATLARDRFLDGDPRGKSVVVLAGTGGNGGGALVAARRLHGWGAAVRAALGHEPDRFAPVSAKQLTILRRLGVEILSPEALVAIAEEPKATAEGPTATSEVSPPDLIIDGVIGYSLGGAPHGGAEALIRWSATTGAPILSLDVPSGLDATSGEVHEPTVRSTATLTLALPKTGLVSGSAREHVGELYLSDIGIPRQLYPEIDLPDPGELFAIGDLIRLTP